MLALRPAPSFSAWRYPRVPGGVPSVVAAPMSRALVCGAALVGGAPPHGHALVAVAARGEVHQDYRSDQQQQAPHDHRQRP
eukprot:764334-Rhodomonas_salina.2